MRFGYFLLLIFTLCFEAYSKDPSEYPAAKSSDTFLSDKDWNFLFTYKFAEGHLFGEFQRVMAKACDLSPEKADTALKDFFSQPRTHHPFVLRYASAAYFDGKCVPKDRPYSKQLLQQHFMAKAVRGGGYYNDHNQQRSIDDIVNSARLPRYKMVFDVLTAVKQRNVLPAEKVLKEYNAIKEGKRSAYPSINGAKAYLDYMIDQTENVTLMKAQIKDLQNPLFIKRAENENYLAEIQKEHTKKYGLDESLSRIYYQTYIQRLHQLVRLGNASATKVLRCEVLTRIHPKRLPKITSFEIFKSDMSLNDENFYIISEWMAYWTLLKQEGRSYDVESYNKVDNFLRDAYDIVESLKNKDSGIHSAYYSSLEDRLGLDENSSPSGCAKNLD